MTSDSDQYHAEVIVFRGPPTPPPPPPHRRPPYTSDHFDQSEYSVLIQTSASEVVHERHTECSVLFLFSSSLFFVSTIIVALVWVRIFPFAFKERPVAGVISRWPTLASGVY